MSRQTNANSLESFIVDSRITEYGWKYIQSLAKTIVFRYYRTYDTEDLISLAITDLAEFLLILEAGNDVPRSIRNVLFTRGRNTVSNYLYHRRKAVPTEDDILDTQMSDEYIFDDIFYEYNTLEEAHLLSLELWRYFSTTPIPIS